MTDFAEHCPHCDQPHQPDDMDQHIATAHADLPACTATLDNGADGILHCVLRIQDPATHGEYGDHHVSQLRPYGRTIWVDTAIGATPHRPEGQP